MRNSTIAGAALAFAALTAAAPARAQIKIGITLPLTGPAATLGIGSRNALSLAPTRVGEDDVQFIVLDDGTDTTRTVVNMRKFTDEDHVDAVIGSATAQQCLAELDIAAASKTPVVCNSATKAVTDPVDDKRHWMFKTAANDAIMAGPLFAHMQAHGVKTIGFIGFDDAYGEGWLKELTARAPAEKLTIADVERYARRDVDVTGQALKLIAANPDAVLVVASGSPATLPVVALRDHGYRGKIYLSSGVASMDFLRIGGRSLNGAIAGVGPNLVWEQLPDSNPTKAPTAAFMPKYEEKFGKENRSNFAPQAYDAWTIIQNALPAALARGKPGTEAFRVALRDAIEATHELHAMAGVFNYSPTDHAGLDARAAVVVQIVGGKWVLVQ
jgi:branched-chain amino acid transport system substrate-binding protein